MILDRIGIYLSLFKFYTQAIPVCIQQLSYLRYSICIRSIKRYFQYFDWNCSEMAFIWMNFPQISWTCQISIFVVFSMFFPHFPVYSLQSSPQFWHCLPTCQLVRMFILKRVLSVFFASPDTVVCLFFSLICYVERDICILTICLYTEFSLFTNIRCQQIIQWAYEINNII